MRRPSPVLPVLLLTTAALSLPFSFALATTAFAQEPQPPTGEPQQPGAQPQPTPTEPPPQPQQPTAQAPDTVGGGGALPRTGWERTFVLFGAGLILLLTGARLRVHTRIRDAGRRVTRRLTGRPSEVALREALEPIRAARLAAPQPDPERGPLHVEPSTPTARRLTGVAERDRA